MSMKSDLEEQGYEKEEFERRRLQENEELKKLNNDWKEQEKDGLKIIVERKGRV